jgi:hypothetical protein
MYKGLDCGLGRVAINLHTFHATPLDLMVFW